MKTRKPEEEKEQCLLDIQSQFPDSLFYIVWFLLSFKIKSAKGHMQAEISKTRFWLRKKPYFYNKILSYLLIPAEFPQMKHFLCHMTIQIPL